MIKRHYLQIGVFLSSAFTDHAPLRIKSSRFWWADNISGIKFYFQTYLAFCDVSPMTAAYLAGKIPFLFDTTPRLSRPSWFFLRVEAQYQWRQRKPSIDKLRLWHKLLLESQNITGFWLKNKRTSSWVRRGDLPEKQEVPRKIASSSAYRQLPAHFA